MYLAMYGQTNETRLPDLWVYVLRYDVCFLTETERDEGLVRSLLLSFGDRRKGQVLSTFSLVLRESVGNGGPLHFRMR
jgi:hypothetical protein